MRVVSAETDPLDLFDIVVDPNAEPADLDEAVVEFLLKIVERRLAGRSTVEQAAAAKQGGNVDE